MRHNRGVFYAAVAIVAIGLIAGAVGFRMRTRPASRTPATLGRATRTPAGSSGPRANCPIVLNDVTDRTGITFRHTDGSSGRHYIIEAMSAGVAVFDYDGDGDDDIYFLNGAPLLGTKMDRIPRNALYRNDGHWRFTDVTEQAGVGDAGFGLGVTVGDYDNDGDLDLYLNNSGPNVLYRNNGDGTFTDVTEQAGVANGDQVGAGTCFLDMDADGDLDLYVANYLVFRYELHVMRSVAGVPTYPSPRDYHPVPDTLYRNNGDGTFTDVSQQAGIAQHAGSGMGMVCADFDRDGDTDVFVCNDVGPNFFFVNDGTGRFTENGIIVGAAYNGYGDENASMGVDCGDYDNDLWLDFFMTSYQNELPVLYRNTGDGYVEDVTAQVGAGAGVFQHVNWGPGLVDFDNDGDRDIFIANGHTEDNVDKYDNSTTYRAPNTVLVNTGNGRFAPLPTNCGSGLLPVYASRGAGFGDLDNDGDLDAVVLNIRNRPTLIRNDSPGGNHWLQIDLRGVECNRFGVGAQVIVEAGSLKQIDEVHSGRGYQSHWGLRLHFGLGRHEQADRIEVHWPGGHVDVLENVAADRRVTIVEGGRLIAPGEPQ